MFQNFNIGLNAYSRALNVVKEKNLWPYLLVPGLMSFVFFTLILIAGYFSISSMSESLMSYVPEFLQIGIITFFINLIIWILLILFGMLTFRYVILILLAPVLSHLSEATENKIYGRAAPKMNIRDSVKDFIRALRINLRNLFLEIITIIILNLIPFLNFISPVTVFITQSYFAGFGLLDIHLEIKRLSYDDTKRFVKNRRGLASGIGSVFTALNFLPVVGWFLAPTLGTVAATICSLDIWEEKKKAYMQMKGISDSEVFENLIKEDRDFFEFLVQK